MRTERVKGKGFSEREITLLCFGDRKMKRHRKKNTRIYRIFNYSLQFADEKIARDPDFDGL